MKRSKRNEFEKEPWESIKRIDYQVLYFCDDAIGFPGIIAKELGVSEREVMRILQSLESRGLVIKETGGMVSYITTERGNKLLKQIGPYK